MNALITKETNKPFSTVLVNVGIINETPAAATYLAVPRLLFIATFLVHYFIY